MYFKLYQDRALQWRWTLFAANHYKVADSGEGYYNEANCFSGIRLVQGTTSTTPIYK